MSKRRRFMRSLLERMQRQGEEAQRLRAWVQRELPGFLTREHGKALFEGWISSQVTPVEPSAGS